MRKLSVAMVLALVHEKLGFFAALSTLEQMIKKSLKIVLKMNLMAGLVVRLVEWCHYYWC